MSNILVAKYQFLDKVNSWNIYRGSSNLMVDMLFESIRKVAKPTKPTTVTAREEMYFSVGTSFIEMQYASGHNQVLIAWAAPESNNIQCTVYKNGIISQCGLSLNDPQTINNILAMVADCG